MRPVFNFTAKTIAHLSPKKQEMIEAPFTISREDYLKLLSDQFKGILRRAGRIEVRDMTILVTAGVPGELKNYPAIIVTPSAQNPQNWGYGFQYRADTPWMLACLEGNYEPDSLFGFQVVKLLKTRDLINWRPLPNFMSDGLWGLQQNKYQSNGLTTLLNWNPLENFLFGISPYLRPSIVGDLDVNLTTVNFFPLETDLAAASSPNSNDLSIMPWRLEIDKSDKTWQEIEAMSDSFFRPLVDPEMQKFWVKVRKHPRTQVITARSSLYPETDVSDDPVSKLTSKPEPTLLGFLVGGINPVNEQPQIHALCVLPDERRRGIATSLINRFFTQTGFASATVGIYMGPRIFQYEGAGFLKRLRAKLETKGAFIWNWHLPSPLQARQCDSRLEK